MDLSCELLLDFFEQARKYVKKHEPERRKGGRLSLAASARLHVLTSSQTELIEATVSNLSTSGLALSILKPLPIGQEFAVRLPTKGIRVQWVRCSVARCNPAPGNSHHIGARFSDIVRTDSGEIPLLLDPASPLLNGDPVLTKIMKDLATIDSHHARLSSSATGALIGKDNRGSRRVPIRYFSSAILIEGDAAAQRIRIHMQDLSTSGVGFLTAVPIVIGARVAMTLNFSNNKSKAILARVVRFKPEQSGQFLIGTELLEACDKVSSYETMPRHWFKPQAVPA